MQSEISCRNPVKYNVKYIAGLCSAYLFVAGSIILLQCLSMIQKPGANLTNDEIWRLLLLEQIPTFGELDKINIMSNRWKRNKFTWHLFQQGLDLRWTFWKSHALGAALSWFFSILTHVNLSKSKHYSVKTFEKTSIKFHVTRLPRWQKVLLIFRNIGRSIADENSFHFLLSKYFVSKHCSFTKISRNFFLLIISC